MGRDRIQQAREQSDVDHRGFVDDKKITDEGLVNRSCESEVWLELEEPVNRKGVLSRAFGKSFCRPASGSAKHRVNLFGEEDLEQGLDDRGFPNSGSTGDHGKSVLRGTGHRCGLLRPELERKMSFKPFDRALGLNRRQGRGAIEHSPDRLCNARFGFVEIRREQEGVLSVVFGDDLFFEQEMMEREVECIDFALECPGSIFEQLFAGEGAVTVSFRLFEDVKETCGETAGRINRLTHLGGDLVGGAEPYPGNLTGEAIGIGTEDVHRLLSVGFVKSYRPRCGNAAGVEKNHDVPDRFLPFPGIFDAKTASLPDSGDFFEALRFLLDDSKGIVPECCDDPFGVGRADPIDQATREKSTNSVRSGRW